jgi:hypothetical protein
MLRSIRNERERAQSDNVAAQKRQIDQRSVGRLSTNEFGEQPSNATL